MHERKTEKLYHFQRKGTSSCHSSHVLPLIGVFSGQLVYSASQ